MLSLNSLKGLSITVVDDEQDLLDVLADSLRIAGATVDAFSHPNDAQNHVRDNSGQIDALLTDQTLGATIKGSDLTAWMNEHYPHIPCFIMTGYSADAALNSVNALILEKPMPIAEITRKISQSIDDIRPCE